MESLEDRRVLSITVDNPFDELDADRGPGDTSLREAIADANAADNIIDFAPSLNGKTIELLASLGGEIEFNKSLTIDASMLLGGLTIDANDPTPTTRNGDGFRIFNITDTSGGSAPPLVEFVGLTLTGADVSGDGGAISSEAILLVRDSIIIGNKASRGGGIFVEVAGSGATREVLKIENSTLQDNEASKGGGLAVISGTTSSSTTDTIVITNNTKFLNNDASGSSSSNNGGGVYAQIFGAQLTIEDNTLFSLNDSNRGGAIYADLDAAASLILNQSQVKENDAFGGAGLHLKLNGSSQAHIEATYFFDNTATSSGGGLLAQLSGSSSLEILLSTFEQNNAGDGAGISMTALTQSAVHIQETVFDTNEATDDGGGIFALIQTGASIEILDSQFLSNKANGTNNGGGGGAYFNMTDASAHIDGSLFELNTSESAGGGIYSTGSTSASLLIENSEITGNVSAGDGGGISAQVFSEISNPFPTPRAITISRSLVSGNSSGSRGGGIYTRNREGTEILIEDSRFESNASFNGGGIYAYVSGNTAPKFTISRSTVDNNHAEFEGGGIFVCAKGAAEFVAVNSTVSGNSTTDSNFDRGGGIFIGRAHAADENVDTILQNVTITQNHSSSGGGIEIDNFDNMVTQISNSIISENFDHQSSPNNLVGRIDPSSLKYNLIGTGGSGILDLSGIPYTPDNTNIISDNPGLSPLMDNGGPTPTHSPLSGSEAIDAGNPAYDGDANIFPVVNGMTLTTDQRGPGFSRVYDVPGVGRVIDPTNPEAVSIIDIGAYEINPPKVIDVAIRGTNILDGENGLYSIPTGSGEQIRTVPIGGAEKIEVAFSEAIDATTLNDALTLIGVFTATDYTTTANPDVVLQGLDSTGTKATWEYTPTVGNDQFPADQMVLLLAESLMSTAGLALDGEWVNPVDVNQDATGLKDLANGSGDGDAGGKFGFFFTILPGDASLDNDVDVFQFDGNGDAQILTLYFGTATDATFIIGDFDGDGDVDVFEFDGTGDGQTFTMNNSLNFVLFNNLLGDFDGDYKVDLIELSLITDEINAGTNDLTYDLNGDGQVTDADYDLAFALFEIAVVVP